MSTIKNIIFDFGGVLVDWNPRYFYRTFFWDESEMESFLATICTDEWNAEHDRGRSFADGIRLLQQKHPEYSEAIRLFRDGWEEMLKGDFPESVALLRRLKEERFGIYGLTNWSAETIGIAYRRFDFFKLFDGIVVSGEEKLIKPDKRIYRVLLDRYGLEAGECLFIDDNTANVEAARELGLHALLFDDIANVRSRLEALLKG
ncbi:HAD family hydrolase [Alistipes finegoldii]|uniref:HAD family hydrolase n=1 Tax=Alistipes finegoldii TaxID=214856 RepID=UPI003AB81490